MEKFSSSKSDEIAKFIVVTFDGKLWRWCVLEGSLISGENKIHANGVTGLSAHAAFESALTVYNNKVIEIG